MPVKTTGTRAPHSSLEACPRPRQLVVALLLFVTACTEPFAPEMPFEQQIVVYGILSNVASEQPLRVFTTYSHDALNLDGPGPNTNVTDALVVVADASGGVSQVDTCLYSIALSAYVWSPAPLVRGRQYRLSVEAGGIQNVEAVTVVPREAVVTPGNVFALREPSTYVSDFTVSTRLPVEAKASIVQLLVEYEYNSGGVWLPGRTEVPLRLVTTLGGGAAQHVYPELVRRLNPSDGGEWVYQYTAFESEAYAWALSQIRSRYLSTGLKFRRAVVRVTQLDEHLYNYYSIANGFRDPHTIRVDQPDYTNVVGGYGIFGAAVADSILILLPESIR